MLRFLSRRQIDDVAWDRCVAGAHNALLYGHTWYLDAVTNVPGWTWEGLVVDNVPADGAAVYQAVLPVPLRRRWGRWVVYQPLFCQFLAIFSRQPVDPVPFIHAVYARYRHASKWHLLLANPLSGLPTQVRQQVLYTHILNLGDVSYAVSPRYGVTNAVQPLRYSSDRRMNLRRASRRTANVPGWQLVESADVEPLLALFRENHAREIGVGEGTYGLFRGLFAAIQQQKLGTLRYARAGEQLVAGVLFVEQYGRIIYLFNAANAEGRRLNARSILLDELIRHELKKAQTESLPIRSVLDFESPEKPGVVSFYESFGAVPQPYLSLNWSRLTWLERVGKRLLKRA